MPIEGRRYAVTKEAKRALLDLQVVFACFDVMLGLPAHTSFSCRGRSNFATGMPNDHTPKKGVLSRGFGFGRKLRVRKIWKLGGIVLGLRAVF